MKTIIKIMTIAAIMLFSISIVSAALNTGLQAPAEFEHSIYWDRNNDMDIYALKNDNNTLLYVEEYNADDDKILLESDPEFNYYVTPMGNNTYLGLDQDLHDGYVIEVVEYDGVKYIVNTYLTDNPDNAKVTDSAKYLVEFNKLNNVEPVAV